jgi:membrane associated rhomboid family serine protease
MEGTNASITLVLVILTGFISWQGFRNPDFLHKMMFSPWQVKRRGEYQRFLTAGFVHGNWMHLAVNLYVLYQFGEIAELFFQYLMGPVGGPISFIVFYLSALAISSLPSFLQHQDNHWYAELGASGATSALVFVYILMDPWQWFLFPPMPAVLLGVAYLWYSHYMGRHNPEDHIAHNAHFIGALYGVAYVVTASLAFRPAFLQQFVANLLQGPSWPF